MPLVSSDGLQYSCLVARYVHSGQYLELGILEFDISNKAQIVVGIVLKHQICALDVDFVPAGANVVELGSVLAHQPLSFLVPGSIEYQCPQRSILL